jgi:nitrous oxidase accessory protein NosD
MAKTPFLIAALLVAGGIVHPLYSQQDRNLPAKDPSSTVAAKQIRISGDYTVTGARTFDRAAAVELMHGGKFVKGQGGRLIFKRPPKTPRQQIFEGFLAGEVIFEGGCQVSPQWWGASGNGNPGAAAANVAAINAALAAVANSGGSVLLDGLYYVNDTIRPLSGSKLAAAGRGVIVAVPKLPLGNPPPPLGHYLIAIDGQSAVTIDGIELDGNRTGQVQDARHACGGVLFVKSSGCTITNCKVHDCNGQTTGGAIGNGIRTNTATDILISKNQLSSNNGCGINVYYDSRRVRVAHNTLWNNTEIGIESEGRRGVDYTNHRNSMITICGNKISSNTEPRRLGDHSILVDWTDNSAILGNECKNSRSNGIEILGSRQVTVAGNRCENHGQAGPPAIWAAISVTAETYGEDGRSQNVTIRDNRIAGSRHGIYVNTANRVLITANKITGAIHDALKIGAGTVDVSVSGNDCGPPKNKSDR